MKVGQWPVFARLEQAMPWFAARSGLLLLYALLMTSPTLQADSSSTELLPTPLTPRLLTLPQAQLPSLKLLSLLRRSALPAR